MTRELYGLEHRGTSDDGKAANTRLIGAHDLQGRSALQVTLRDDWCYVGHLPGHAMNDLTGRDEPSGTSILDVSDPTRPRLVSHIPAAPEGTCRAVQFARRGGRDFIVRVHEIEGAKSANGPKSLQIFDVTDRAKPKLVSEITESPLGRLTWAHKGWWDEETGMYFCSVGEVGFRMGGHFTAWDLSDPAKPSFVGRHWLRGQRENEPEVGKRAPTMHHPIVDMKAKRAYIGYPWGGDLEVLDITDLEKPRSILHFTIAPTFNKGPHTLLPYLGVRCPDFSAGIGDVRDFIAFCPEANNARPDTKEVRTMLFMLDITAPENPMTIDTWRVPDEPYLTRGGRFGPHQFAETRDGTLYDAQKNGGLLYAAWFSGGLRVIDISDPFRIREVGHYVPDITDKTFETFGHRVIQTNDVDIDHRGLLYLTCRAGTGMHVVKYEGAG